MGVASEWRSELEELEWVVEWALEWGLESGWARGWEVA